MATRREETPHLSSMAEALDEAHRLLKERFGDPDQDAVVQLAQALWACQERERFEHRHEEGEIPYRA